MKKLKLSLLIFLILLVALSAYGCSPSPSPKQEDYSLKETKKQTLITQGQYTHVFEKYGYIALKVSVFKSLPTSVDKPVYRAEVTSQFIPVIHLKQHGESTFGKYFNKSGYLHITVIPDGGAELKQKDFYPCNSDGIMYGACPSSYNLDEIQWGFKFPSKTDWPYMFTANYCFGSEGIDSFNLKLDCKFTVKNVTEKDNYCSFNLAVNADKGSITEIN